MAKSSFSQKIKNFFIAGILTSLPIVITVYLLYFLYNLIISKASPIVRRILRQYNLEFSEYTFQLLTILFLILMILLIGLITHMYLGRILIRMMDKVMAKIPIASSIYNATKQVIDSFGGASSGSAFSKVVLVEFPRRDMWMIAFLVKETMPLMEKETTMEESSNVFIPTAPNPTSGFVAVVPNKDIRYLDLSVEDGIKFVLSIGIINFDNKNDVEKIVKRNI